MPLARQRPSRSRAAERRGTPKAREETVATEPAPPAVAKKKAAKRTAYKSRAGKGEASAYRHKRAYAHKKHRKPRYAHAHGRKHRAYAAEVVYVDRRCDCSMRPRVPEAAQEPPCWLAR